MKLLVLLFTFLSFYSGWSQIRIPFYENGKIGFADEKGQEIIPATFHEVEPYSKGLAVARADKGFGFIDSSGQFVIKPIYEYATSFVGDRAIVFINKLPIVIDLQGNQVFHHDYDFISQYKYSSYRGSNHKLNSYHFYAVAKLKGKPDRWVTIDSEGQEILGGNIKSDFDFDNGYSIVILGSEKINRKVNGLPFLFNFGLINLQGDTFLRNKKISAIQNLRNGYFKIQTCKVDSNFALNYYLFSTKKWNRYPISAEIYDELNEKHFNQGYIKIRKNRYLNFEGKEVNLDLFHKAKSFTISMGNAIVKDSLNQYWLMDIKGNLLLNRPFLSLERFLNTALYLGKDSTGDHLIDPKGRVQYSGDLKTAIVFFSNKTLVNLNSEYDNDLKKYIGSKVTLVTKLLIKKSIFNNNKSCNNTSELCTLVSPWQEGIHMEPNIKQRAIPANYQHSINKKDSSFLFISTQKDLLLVEVCNISGSGLNIFYDQINGFNIYYEAYVNGSWQSLITETKHTNPCVSYDSFYLKPNKRIALTELPCFEGSYSTKIRVRLIINSTETANSDIILTSNTLHLSINKAQLWRKGDPTLRQ